MPPDAQRSGAKDPLHIADGVRRRSQPEKKQLSEAERKAALQYLKSADLLERARQAIAASGIIGEKMNGLIAYLVYTSRKLRRMVL